MSKKSFTYIDNIVEIISKLINKPAVSDYKLAVINEIPLTAGIVIKYQYFSKTLVFIKLLEDKLGI